jgi:hypothetical protein
VNASLPGQPARHRLGEMMRASAVKSSGGTLSPLPPDRPATGDEPKLSLRLPSDQYSKAPRIRPLMPSNRPRSAISPSSPSCRLNPARPRRRRRLAGLVVDHRQRSRPAADRSGRTCRSGSRHLAMSSPSRSTAAPCRPCPASCAAISAAIQSIASISRGCHKRAHHRVACARRPASRAQRRSRSGSPAIPPRPCFQHSCTAVPAPRRARIGIDRVERPSAQNRLA